MIKRLWIVLLIAFLGIAGLIVIVYQRIEPGRSPAQPNVPPVETIPARIVSLSPNITEILFALGLGDNIAAVSSNSNFPPEATGKRKIGTFWQPSTEAIIAARPDLIVTLSFHQQQAVADSLKRLGYNVLTVKIETIEELFAAIERIGRAAGQTQRAAKLTARIKGELSDLQARLDNLANKKKIKVLWVLQTEPMRVAGRNTFVNELIELAGGENAIGPTIQRYPPIGAEEILVCGAEVIIQSAMTAGSLDEQQQAAKLFWSKRANLPAVRNNKIYVVDSDTVLRLGPRLPQGVEMIARCLHLDTFAQSNTTEQAR